MSNYSMVATLKCVYQGASSNKITCSKNSHLFRANTSFSAFCVLSRWPFHPLQQKPLATQTKPPLETLYTSHMEQYVNHPLSGCCIGILFITPLSNFVLVFRIVVYTKKAQSQSWTSSSQPCDQSAEAAYLCRWVYKPPTPPSTKENRSAPSGAEFD